MRLAILSRTFNAQEQMDLIPVIVVCVQRIVVFESYGGGRSFADNREIKLRLLYLYTMMVYIIAGLSCPAFTSGPERSPTSITVVVIKVQFKLFLTENQEPCVT